MEMRNAIAVAGLLVLAGGHAVLGGDPPPNATGQAADGGQVLYNPDSKNAYGSLTGWCVDISGDFAVVGAPFDSASEPFTGNAFVYQYTPTENEYTPDWTFVTELATLPGVQGLTSGVTFGLAVAIDGDRIVVGAPGVGGTGRVYVFREAGGEWALETTLVPWQPHGFGNFASSVAIAGPFVVVGDPNFPQQTGSGGVWTYLLGRGDQPPGRIDPPDDGMGGRRGGEIWEYGAAVAIDGDVIVIGAPGAIINGVNGMGVAYIFRLLGDYTWAYEGAAIPPPPWSTVQTRYGSGVAADGDEFTIVVGGPNSEGGLDLGGVAGVYRKIEGAWTGEEILESDLSDEGAEFGLDVDIDSDRIVVGVHQADENGPGSGQFDVFRYRPTSESWTRETSIVPHGGHGDAWTGWSVAIDGERVLAGAPRARVAGVSEDEIGMAYIYTPGEDGQWQADTRIRLPIQLADGQIDNHLSDDLHVSLGQSMVISGNVALVGDPRAPRPGGKGGATGQVHVHTRTSESAPWVLDTENKIPVPAGVDADDRFGYSVDMTDNVAVVGAPDNGDTLGGGSTWLFHRDQDAGTWSAGTLVRSGAAREHVGTSVAIATQDGFDYLIASGAPHDGNQGLGRVYLNGWSEGDGAWNQGTLSGSGGGQYSVFGTRVDVLVDDDGYATIAVGDPEWPGFAGEAENRRGAVEIFHQSPAGGWPLVQTIDPLADVNSATDFGHSLDLDGDLLAIGDPMADVLTRSNCGRAFVYRRDSGADTWSYEYGRESPFFESSDYFGWDVQVRDASGSLPPRMFVGAPGVDYITSNCGAVVSFGYSDVIGDRWAADWALVAEDPITGEGIGMALALDSSDLFVGGSSAYVDSDEVRVLEFILQQGVTFIGWSWGGDVDPPLWAPEVWSIPPTYDQPAAAYFSILLAPPYRVLFETAIKGLWWGSMHFGLNDVTLNLPAIGTISGDVVVAGNTTVRAAVLQVEGANLNVGGDVDVGSAGAAGQLVMIQDRIFATGDLTFGPASSYIPVLSASGAAGGTNYTCLVSGESVDLQGCLAVELGTIDPESLQAGDRWVVMYSNTTPPPGQDRFDIAVLPGISDSLAFQLQYGPPVAGGNEESRGVWEVAVEVVDLSSLLGFGDAETTAVDGTAVAIEVVDLTNDGAAEICVIFDGTPGQLAIFENDGIGGVDQVTILNTGDQPVDITSGDFDDNGFQDLAVANYLTPDTISVYLNDNGNVTDGFDSGDFDPGVLPTCLTSFDYLGLDDLDDLAIGFEALSSADGGFVIFSPFDSLRDFGFGNTETLTTSGVPGSADPNEDEEKKTIPFGGVKSNGKAVAARVTGALVGPSLTLDEYDAGAGLVDLVIDDIDGDGLSDLVTTSSTNNAIAILLQNPDGSNTFLPALQVPAGTSPGSLTAIDFDADGNKDLATVTTDLAGSVIVRVLQNDGSLGFTSVDMAEGEFPVLVDSGDIDGSGTNDLVTIGNGGSALRGSGAPLLALRATETLCDCEGDADCDSDVDVEDLLAVIAEYGCTSRCTADVDGDGDVDVEDVLTIISAWGTCDRAD